MKFIFVLLLILLLLLNISCINLINLNEELTIRAGLECGIVYVKLDNFSQAEKIYVRLEIDAQKVDDYIEAEFCDTQTVDPHKFLKYYHYMALYAGYSGSKIYYYKIDYKKYNYIYI